MTRQLAQRSRLRPLRRLLVVLALAATAPAAWATPFAGLMFDDGASLSPEALLPAYRDLLGNPLDDALAERLRVRLVDYYRSRGFLPPAPRLVGLNDAAGIVVMELREPRVARVQLDGREHVDATELDPLLRELTDIRPLSHVRFAGWLERANDRGMALRGALVRSSESPYEYIASLRADARRWHGLAHLDNRGPAQIGHEVAQLSVTYAWPRPAFGQLRVDAAAAVDHRRLRYAALSGTHRVSVRGNTLRWKYARSESTLPIPDTTRRVDYDRERAELAYVAPLQRRSRLRTDLSLMLRSYDVDQDLDDGRALRRDRIRALELDYGLIAAADGGGRHSARVSLNQGIDTLGASLWPDGADPTFTALTVEYGYRSRIARWQWFGDVSAQASGDRMPASERFFIGGSSLGGAFDPATLSGDEGLGARLGIERSFDAPALARPLTVYSYYDHAWVWSHDADRPADDAGSAGLGVRGEVAGLVWNVEVGVPVQTPDTPTLLEDDLRVFFSLTQRF